MKSIYDEVSFSLSKIVTQKYSTSFSMGIKALHPQLREAIYSIYGFVRLADEIVDSFHGYNQKQLLIDFKNETEKALAAKISLNPIIHSFQETVHKYQIEEKLIHQFLHSMEMDLEKIEYNSDLYKEYILGSAEVVGLMCLHIFVEGDKVKYDELKPFAMKLGSAFQKINFLRDLRDDYYVLGRTYFPNVDLTEFNDHIKMEIERDINTEFEEALIGINRLPITSKFGVYLAYKYYFSLFKKIQKSSAKKVLNERIRIPNSDKFLMLSRSYLDYKFSNLV
ncbi:phytoene/squalene synthase family protein [Faecalibacter macacae]|uniref:Phytoene/squalene synthase family protein n=1 Tax=Faecalibacter macacae TaxID=1859289 RepID=A0A3L9MCN0_9FLAO|nr:phytoene/squalene synthase family protein [Faecalibacter macacae]RLZ10758.1 phytoene/squalene synthase family protein [Faecalibacter macacae]